MSQCTMLPVRHAGNILSFVHELIWKRPRRGKGGCARWFTHVQQQIECDGSHPSDLCHLRTLLGTWWSGKWVIGKTSTLVSLSQRWNQLERAPIPFPVAKKLILCSLHMLDWTRPTADCCCRSKSPKRLVYFPANKCPTNVLNFCTH